VRFKVIDRIVSALSGLVILVIGIGLFVFGIGIFPFRLDLSFLDMPFVLWQRAIMVAASLLLFFFGLRGLSLLFRSNKEKGFILQHTEYGDLSISMTAMENMVKKCVDTHSELKVAHTRILHAREGVTVNLRIALANGVNIPITVSALQKQIKQYITSCSGVDVKEVRVMVETNNALQPSAGNKTENAMSADVDAAEKAGAVVDTLREVAQNVKPAEAAHGVKPEKEPLHMRLFKHEDKQQIIPQPPVTEPIEATEAVACALAPDEDTRAKAETTPLADDTATLVSPDKHEENKEEV